MILVDLNLLLYAYDPSSPYHANAGQWWKRAVAEERRVGLAWMTILGFLRITTNPRVGHPISLAKAVVVIAEWLEQPSVVILDPGERHWSILSKLLPEAQARGPLVMDAHLAALAIEHGATLCSNDRDFVRFPGLKVLNPLET